MKAAELRVTESQLHASVADLLDWALMPPAVWTTFPAGWGRLGAATAGWLKRCGLKEGVPDILIFFHGRTLAIELKVGNNKQSPAQRHMQHLLDGAGVPVRICRSVDGVWATINSFEYLRPVIRKMEVGGKYGT